MEYQKMKDLVQSELLKNKGRWAKIARGGTISYFTIARIAHGKTSEPRPSTLNQLLVAIKALQ